MNTTDTALILIGFQNDYFSAQGILKDILTGIPKPAEVMHNTLNLLAALRDTPLPIFTTPIIFTEDYSEISEASGILSTIKEVEAFKEGTPGAQTSPEIAAFGDRIREVKGKRGLNAFYRTELEALIRADNIKNIVFAGAVTSVCIDSSARFAYEHDYNVTILSDCTSGRTSTEQDFYCSSIFPIYADVKTYAEVLFALGLESSG